MEHVVGAQADHPEVSCHLVCPFVEVVLRVKDDGGVASCATAGVQTHAVGQGYCGKAEGIGVAEVLLRGEGKLANVGRRGNVFGLDAHLLELLFIERNLGTTLDGLLQALGLQLVDFFSRERFVLGMKVRIVVHSVFSLTIED